MLKDQIEQDLVTAMKSKDENSLLVLRMLKSALKNKEIEKKNELDESDIIGVIQSQIKSRRDSVQMYKTGNREDLAQKEEKEIEILQKYLPEQMSEQEVRAVVKNAIATTGATQISDMGKVMGSVMGELKGKADGSMISTLVKEELNKNKV